MDATVRTRFSPSPTGDLHAGGLRTALFNFLFARANNGAFILRIEDTDTVRSDKRYEERITEDLAGLGLVPDEAPGTKTEFGPYRQSERNDIYIRMATGLINSGHAYRCYCTRERLTELKEAAVKAGRPPRYDGRCANLAKDAQGEEHVIRFRVRDGSIRFLDSLHGEMSFESSAFGDFVIVGSDGVAGYNFAVTVDDALMNITDVIRGDDHLANTPRQLLLYEALELAPPRFAHLPLVLAPDSAPLSKRHSHLSIRALKSAGFLDSAILNTVARLGWSPDTNGSATLMSLEEMAQKFDGKRLSRSPSLFDPAHLTAFNRLAIERLQPKELLGMLSIETAGATSCSAEEAVAAVRHNCGTLKEVEELARTLLVPDISFTEEAERVLKERQAKEVVGALLKALEESIESVMDGPLYKKIIDAVRRSAGLNGRKLFMPVRCALTGRTDGIELEKIFQLLGTEAIIQRLRRRL